MKLLGALPLAAYVIAGAVLLVLLAVASQYGFHRDEMYFILAGRHPAFGYVDQPPLTPIVSAVAVQAFGLSPVAIRILPAFVTATVILLCASMARTLGASPRGQALAALVLALSGWLGAGHLDETATYDILGWTVVTWLLLPLLSKPEGAPVDWRRWIAIGLAAGIALENKTLPIFLAATVAAGVLLTRRWDILRSPGPWLAIGLAFVIWLPNLAWQAAHDFPQLQMAGQIAGDQSGIGDRIKSIIEYLLVAGPFLFPVAIAGLVWLLRAPEARPWRSTGLAVALLFVLMLAIGGKSYYSAGYLPLLVAAGAGPLDRWLARGRIRLRVPAFASAATASGFVITLALLPIVPVGTLHATPIPGIYAESVAQVGWPELADQVRGVVDSLPAADRSKAVIVTSNYGQWGALELYGHGLPPVYSGHNSVYDWGRPPDGANPVILVNWSPGYAATLFVGCQIAGRIDNGLDLETEEQSGAILVCSNVGTPWSVLWPMLRHID